MIVKIIDAIRFLLAILIAIPTLVAILTITVFFSLKKLEKPAQQKRKRVDYSQYMIE